MAWSDYRKAYDMIPLSWIIERLEMFGIAENMKKFIIDSWGIIEAFSKAICFVHDSIKIGIEIINSGLWSREAFKVNHLLSMDALKLFGKSED